MMKRTAAVWLAFVLPAQASFAPDHSTLIPDDRRIDWTQTGVPGGIPQYPNGVNVMDFGASASDAFTIGSMTKGSNRLTVSSMGNFKVGQGVYVDRAYGAFAVQTLEIVSGATETGHVTIDLPSAGLTDVPVAAGDSPAQVAAKIRAVEYWTWINTIQGNSVIFTRRFKMTSEPGNFSAGSTGVRAILRTVETGGTDKITKILAINNNVFTLADVADNTIVNTTVEHDDVTAIQAAINAAVDQTAVYLPEGKYVLHRSIVMYPSAQKKFALRGAGPGKTIIVGSLMASSAGGPIVDVGVDDGHLVGSVTSGFEKDSQQVTVSGNTSGVVPGMLMAISQKDEPGLVFRASAGTWPVMNQTVRIAGVSGNMISFEPPLHYSFKPELDPVYSILSAVLSDSGIEDLTVVSVKAGNQNIYFHQTYGCWIRNVESANTNAYHVQVGSSLRGEIRDSYFHDQLGSGSNKAGLIFTGTNNFLVENNILMRLGPAFEIFGVSNGNVFAYNYSEEAVDPGGIIGSDLNVNHAPHSLMNLWEGNHGMTFQSDGYHGSSSHYTVFRNEFTGTHYQNLPNRTAVNLNRWSYYFNMVGNVLGRPDFNDTNNPPHDVGLYEPTVPMSYGPRVIYLLGWPDVGNRSFVGTSPPSTYTSGGPESLNKFRDLKVAQTLLRVGNFDYVHDCTWNDAAGACLDTAGVSALNLPPSLYLSTRPTWWNNWGTTPWPPIGPDVPGLANKLPAQLRYEGGALGGSATSVPTILYQPQDLNALVGSSAIFSVYAYGPPPLRYQWRDRNGVDIPGATDLFLTISQIKESDQGNLYTCVITNGAGSTVSRAATLRVRFPTGVTGANPPGGFSGDGSPLVGSAVFEKFKNAFSPLKEPTLTVPFLVAETDAYVKMTVIDRTGDVVRTVVDGEYSPGAHTGVWDGKNSKGQPVVSGIYTLRLKSGGSAQTRKIVVLR